jgi:hypothetical protein
MYNFYLTLPEASDHVTGRLTHEHMKEGRQIKEREKKS